MAVGKARNTNKICLLSFDVNALKAIKKSNVDHKSIFLMTQSDEILQTRISTKGSPTEEQIEDKMLEAKSDNAYGKKDNFIYLLFYISLSNISII
jgi:guanylate kinase